MLANASGILIKSILILIIMVFWARLTSGDTAELNRFLKEYPPAAARFMEQRSPLKGSGMLNLTIKSVVIPQRIFFSIDRGVKATIQSATSKGESGEPELVFCTGPDGSFSVRRRERRGVYTVEAIGDAHSGVTTSDHVRDYVGRFTSAPFAILDRPLLEIMSHSSFKFMTARSFTKDNQEIVEIGYSYKPSDIQISDVLELLPQRNWAIRRCERRVGNPGTLSFISQVEYGDDDHGIPSPIRAIHSNPPEQSAELIFAQITHEKTSDREFTLASYGFADLNERIDNLPSRTRSLIVPLLTAAVAALVGSILLRKIGSQNPRT